MTSSFAISTYATSAQLTARLSSAYTLPANADQLLVKASELIDFATMGRAELAWNQVADATHAQADIDAIKTLLSNATCDQVEYWLEVGEESDVVALQGAVNGGRLQISKSPGTLGQRALRQLIRAGLFWAGVPAR